MAGLMSADDVYEKAREAAVAATGPDERALQIDYDALKEKFRAALALDSTFALAGVGSARAGEWFDSHEDGAEIAWRHRDRLSRRDRARLETVLGPRHPASPRPGELIAAAERLADLAPGMAPGEGIRAGLDESVRVGVGEAEGR